jgi:hypothetical protein
VNASNREMKKRTKVVRGESSEQGDFLRVEFCTECNATLENYCFSSNVNDIESICKTLRQCKKQGKFSGDFCSKLFIAQPEAFSDSEPHRNPHR